MAGGHQVYGLYVTAGVGYRDNAARGVATGGAGQDAYLVASGTHVNGGCCFDYGNAETNSDDNGNGHMDAINFGTECWFAPCSGAGPRVQADLENGLFAGANGSDANNHGNPGAFVTALVKDNGQDAYAIKGGSARSGGLTTRYSGALPDRRLPDGRHRQRGPGQHRLRWLRRRHQLPRRRHRLPDRQPAQRPGGHSTSWSPATGCCAHRAPRGCYVPPLHPGSGLRRTARCDRPRPPRPGWGQP